MLSSKSDYFCLSRFLNVSPIHFKPMFVFIYIVIYSQSVEFSKALQKAVAALWHWGSKFDIICRDISLSSKETK